LTLRAQGADFSMNEFKFAMHYSGVKFHLGVHADEEVEDAQEYLQRLKGDEWETMGTNEQSQIDLLAPYLLEDEAYEGGPKVGEDYRLVPYSGGGEMRPALLNREVDCSWAVGTWVAEEDSLESVACVAPERDPVLPDVPTLQEQGYPPLGPVVTARHALMFNPGVPDFVPRAWADAWAEVIDQDEVQEWSEESGNWLVNVGPQEMQDMVSEMEELIDEYARVPQ
ncbi:MAG: tripartite tricarboxylate transporter substrate-binding protein, partial [Halobacteriales archaeon]|nr:tripartite tricarboxylate transporter substrate-binding protein [Halobacteriales archaeon]